MTAMHTANHLNPKLRQRGISLVELMVSIVIGLVLLLGLVELMAQQSRTRDELDKSTRQVENGRYALQLLHDDIEHAGYWGEYNPASGTNWTTFEPCTDPLQNNLGFDPGQPQVPVAIYPYPSGVQPTCPQILAQQAPNTAAIAVRRLEAIPAWPNGTALQPANIPAASATWTLFQVSQCSTGTVPFVIGSMVGGTTFGLFNNDCVAAPPGSIASVRNYIERIYYIARCNNCGVGGSPGDGIPTLKMVQFGQSGATFTAPIPLVEGIENMQFDYGIDDEVANPPIDGAPDRYTNTPQLADLPRIVSVRINLLARNNDPSPDFSDNKAYCLSGIKGQCADVGVPNGPMLLGKYSTAGLGFPRPPICGGTDPYPQLCNYKRHVFTEVVRAINPSGRRAQY
jgi:type IV pilus assembly protein PilW